MKHLGDITKINSADIESVDVIIGGSPCQDLSVAGNRAGLDGDRSGLFMEQIRIVREMRNATNGNAARFMVWENVPGAFSSNKAEDFRIVLEETAKVADGNAVIPRPPKGKWANSGCIMGDGWSIAWRVQDAQFWGVPQRRRRIALVADFGGHAAPEILFEREGVSRDITESGAEREGTARDVAGGVGTAEPVVFDGANVTSKYNVQNPQPGDPCFTLSTDSRNYVIQDSMIGRADKNGPQGDGINEDVCFTLNTTDRHAVVSAVHQNQCGELRLGEVANTLNTNSNASGRNAPLVMAHGQANAEISEGVCSTLNCNHEQPIACFQNTGQGWWNETDKAQTLRTPCGGNSTKANLVGNAHAVRRLTPLECERLQGFPDGWTDIPDTYVNGKLIKTSDSARYKALGNSIALPPWRFVLYRIRAQGAVTMGSLFDGIGGFPLIWNESGGRTLWASEIEPFCIAVTMIRFSGQINERSDLFE